MRRDTVSILDDLNPEQREAVVHGEGPLLIFAGAGSGKTRALTYRIAYLVHERGVPPERLLAVTFTNKAANEMKERIRQLVGEQADRIWAGTFHSICARLLRRQGQRIGIQPSYSIFDTGDQQALVKECLSLADVDPKQWPPAAVLDTISQAKNELIDPQRFKRTSRGRSDKVTARVYQLYQERLAQNNALDFDDLIMKTVELLEQAPDVLEQYQGRFQHILVDEYQDINYAQYKFVTTLAGVHRNIAVVGDDDQSIYGWRGANVGLILDFENDYPDARVIKLEQNYRSTQKILECAYEIIKRNASRADKRLWTENHPGENIVCYEAVNEQEEATYIAETIRERAQAARRKWSDFAVLYRTNAQSRVIEEAFLSVGLPYRIVGGLRFYERKEIKDLLAYLRVLQNPRDGVSLRRIIGEPPRGIGDKTIGALDRLAYERNVPLFEAMQMADDSEELAAAPQQAVKAFVATMASLMERVDKLTITELTNALLDETAYLPELLGQGTAEAASRVENVQEFLSVTQQFQKAREEPTLGAFLEHISLLTDIDDLEDQGNAVALMTLHSAKGLEFPVVFIAGMEEELLPHRRSMGDDRELEEERRLCYVGITRAQEMLYLTRAYRRTIFGQTQTSQPSRFLTDLPAEFVDRREEITQLKLAAPPAVEAERVVGGPKLDLVKILNRRADRDGDKVRKRAEAAKAVAEVLPAEPEFKAGHKVQHPKFGEGIVITQQGVGPKAEVTVAFKKAGVKKLQLQYAHLERIRGG